MNRLLQPFVDRLEIQTPLSDEERQAILNAACYSEKLDAEKHLVVLGDLTSSACMVLDGICGRIGLPSDDTRQCTAIYLRGELPDLYSFYQPRASTSIVALTAATVVRIPHASLRELLERHPFLGEAFTRYLVADAAIANEWLLNVGGREAISRAAHFFCETAIRMKVEGNNCSYCLPLTQSQLSEIFGMSAVHTNRVLQALRHENLMRINHHKVEIADWNRLKQIGNFDDEYLRPQPRSRHAMANA